MRYKCFVEDARKELGRWGEQLAHDYLARKGYRILEKNVRTGYGEIDLVAQRGDAIIFVEVKTRSSARFGQPESGVNAHKQQHIIRSALAYLQKHPEADGDWQIDVIAIRSYRNRPPEIVHFENAVTG